MLLFLFFTFIILCGRISVQILCVGAILSVLLYLFVWRFMGYSFRRDMFILRKGLYVLGYICVLFYEIAVANVTVMHMILSPHFQPSPVLCTFSVPLRTGAARTMLANAITLTPGTITVRLEDDRFTVHCLDESLAGNLTDSRFVRLLRKMEAESWKR